ncbi:MAG: 3-isopropylmalate dehydratase small subunit 1 [Hyphomicrobiaceae bacterium hypho_1]
MRKFTTLTGIAVPLNIINVDTDMIIPKVYLKTVKRTGLGKALFAEMRYDENQAEVSDFILNKPKYRNAKIIVAGDNFGCGSSREHAPWALLDFGIRAIIAPSFADIFYNNAFKNGILPICISKQRVHALFDTLTHNDDTKITIDLNQQTLKSPDGITDKFEIDLHRKKCLLDGLDDIDITMAKKNDIDSYEARTRLIKPWV